MNLRSVPHPRSHVCAPFQSSVFRFLFLLFARGFLAFFHAFRDCDDSPMIFGERKDESLSLLNKLPPCSAQLSSRNAERRALLLIETPEEEDAFDVPVGDPMLIALLLPPPRRLASDSSESDAMPSTRFRPSFLPPFPPFLSCRFVSPEIDIASRRISTCKHS